MINSEPDQPDHDSDAIRDDVIKAAYRYVLDRDPDYHGLSSYRHLLGSEPLKRLPELLSALDSSSEASLRRMNSKPVIDFDADKRLIANEIPARVIGLGMRCVTAQLLRDMGLRTRSYPFDWIFSSPEVVVHCIEDNFATILDRNEYEAIDSAPQRTNLARCDHRTYRDVFGIRDMFNHHNPLLANDYEYLVRCVQRFKNDIMQNNATLFVVVEDNHPDAEAAYNRLRNVLDLACAGKASLLFISVVSRASMNSVPQLKYLRFDSSHELVRFQAVGSLGGLRFDTAVDQATLEALVRRFELPWVGSVTPIPLPVVG